MEIEKEDTDELQQKYQVGLITSMNCPLPNTFKAQGGGGGGGGATPNNGLYGESPPKMSTSFKLQLYKRMGFYKSRYVMG